MSAYVFEKHVGKVLKSVEVSVNKDKVTLTFADGSESRYFAEGGCCSRSWIEHMEVPGDITGATILGVEDSGSVEEDSEEHECLKVYQTFIRTDRGTVTLEYRNSSNGYYGGYLVESST